MRHSLYDAEESLQELLAYKQLKTAGREGLSAPKEREVMYETTIGKISGG